MIQKSWRHTQQLTVSCRYHNHRAHFNSMLCSDTLLQSSNIRGETNAISGAESNGVREKAGGKTRKWRPNEREKEGVRPRQDEESLGWLLCCLCLLENKACHCAPCACSIQTEAEIEELGCFVLRGGAKWQNVLIEKEPCLLSSHSDTIKQLGEGGSQSLIILPRCSVPFGEWYHETAPHRASHNTVGCLTTVLRQEISWGERALKMPFSHRIILHFLWRLLKAAHPVVAVLTQVIASDEKGHQLPVIEEIHWLCALKGWRENHRDRTKKQILHCLVYPARCFNNKNKHV